MDKYMILINIYMNVMPRKYTYYISLEVYFSESVETRRKVSEQVNCLWEEKSNNFKWNFHSVDTATYSAFFPML